MLELKRKEKELKGEKENKMGKLIDKIDIWDKYPLESAIVGLALYLGIALSFSIYLTGHKIRSSEIVHELNYQGKKQKVICEDIKYHIDKCYILLKEKDKIKNELTDDSGNKIGVGLGGYYINNKFYNF